MRELSSAACGARPHRSFRYSYLLPSICHHPIEKRISRWEKPSPSLSAICGRGGSTPSYAAVVGAYDRRSGAFFAMIAVHYS